MDRRMLILGLTLASCARREEPAVLPPLVSGYRHLTPLRLNVAEIEVAEPAPGAVRVDEPAPLRPERELRQMAADRLVPMGTTGAARFLVQVAEFRRERLSGGGLFSGEPGERLSCRMQVRLEVSGGEGAAGFVETEARRTRTVPDGSSPAARRRAAEEVVRQAMDDMNVEFEFQVRRALRAWLVEEAQTAPPSAPLAPEAIEREDLSGR